MLNMKNVKEVLIFSRSDIESGMANVNQTLQMAQALGSLTRVEVVMRTYKLSNPTKILTTIIGTHPTFCFRGKSLPSVFLTAYFFFLLLQKSRCHRLIYTRSLIVGLIGCFLGFQTCVELHQARLTRSIFLSKIMAYIVRFPFCGSRLRVIVISNALKSIIVNKYGDNFDIKVLHDAAVPPAEKWLDLPKRERKLIVYTGKLENERSVDKLINLAMNFPNCDFRLIGGDCKQVAYYRSMAKTIGVSNVKIFLRQGHRRVSYYQCKADILIAFWSADVPTIDYCSPLKLFEYMQTGNAILVHDFPVLREVLPTNPMIALTDPKDFNNTEKVLKSLLKAEFQHGMRTSLKDYGNRFSYASRARSLIDMFASAQNRKML